MDRITEAIKRGISRRIFLKGAGSLAAVPFLAGLGGTVLTGCSSDSTASTGPDGYNTKLIMLGSSGGVGYWPGSDRASSSSALVVNGSIYLVDLGQGATLRLNQAFNAASLVTEGGSYVYPASSTFLGNIKALFFTHLHQDHVADYPNLLLIGAGSNLGTPTPESKGLATSPLQVIGPCNRGQLDINNNPYWTKEDWLITTDNSDPAKVTPTPGTVQMTDLILQAFAQAANDIMMDDGYPNYKSLVQVSEIGTPLSASGGPTCPATPPFQIYPAGGGADENGVSVQATLVDHRQVYPAFAYRFDTPDGSVVFSGDTGPNTTDDRQRSEGDPALASGNLQALADGADILVHEVIDTAWVNVKFPNAGMAALKVHMLNAHTQIERVGQVAAYCNVKTLVINHIIPGMAPLSHLQQAQRNFPGNLIISADLMRIGVSRLGGAVL
jgi:ribonuclease BN (tRNA processing enzyme)